MARTSGRAGELEPAVSPHKGCVNASVLSRSPNENVRFLTRRLSETWTDTAAFQGSTVYLGHRVPFYLRTLCDVPSL